MQMARTVASPRLSVLLVMMPTAEGGSDGGDGGGDGGDDGGGGDGDDGGDIGGVGGKGGGVGDGGEGGGAEGGHTIPSTWQLALAFTVGTFTCISSETAEVMLSSEQHGPLAFTTQSFSRSSSACATGTANESISTEELLPPLAVPGV